MKNYAIVSDGLVCQVVPPLLLDGKEVPMNHRYHEEVIAQMVEVPDGVPVEPGYQYRGGVFLPPETAESNPPSSADVVAWRDGLLVQASLRIAPLQDAVDLGEATPEEAASLLEWKRYRVDLNRIATQEGFPSAVDWPIQPAAV